MTSQAPAAIRAADEAALGRIEKVVERHTGIRVQAAQHAPVHRAILRRMAEVGEAAMDAYAGRVEAEPGEWRHFIPAITVGETLFFRDRARWASLERHVLPDLARAAGARPVRLWSAGCATGQEAYGLAMAWGRGLTGVTVPYPEVVGSDLNPESLDAARRAEYPERAMRGLSADEVLRFFEPRPGGHRVRAEFRDRVRFEELNLAEWAAVGPWPARFDLILCQHVLIYFAPAVTERVLKALARSLRPGGMLMVGHTETMTPPEGCVLEWVGDSSGFRKPRHGAEARVERAEPAPPGDPARVLEQAWNDTLAERYPAARRRLEAVPLVGEALRLAAWIAVCRGAWAEARSLAGRAVAADVSHPEAHFVAAMAELGAGHTDPALEHLKRAVYLDPAFSVAHFHLAELEARRGRDKAARRAWRNAARASAGDALRILRYLGGFDAAALAQACEGRYAGESP